MKRLETFVPLFVVAVLASACGDDFKSIRCGEGTTEMDGVCVGDGAASCGPGTSLSGEQCLPDGSVICDQGTTFNAATGECELDASACAAGTVLLGGVCVPDDGNLTADLEEAAEPNESTGAGSLTIPTLDQDTTLHGCVTPKANGGPDEDVWVLTTAAPALLEITADGVGGLAAGFIVQDLGITALPNFTRFGINLTGDTSKRQVYLPVAGDYLLVMDDSRALLTGEAAGGANTCYYTTIKQVALPAATTATVPQTTGTDSGNVRVVSYTPGMTGDIFDVTQTTTSTGMVPAFVVRKNGAFYAAVAYDQTNDVPPFYTVGGLEATDMIDVIVDEVYNFSVTPQPYVLDIFDISAQALPVAGTTLTVTKKNGQNVGASWWDRNYLYFDVATAGQIINFDLTSSTGVTMLILRKDVFTAEGAFNTLAQINNTTAGATTFTNQYVRFAQPGRYYYVVLDTDGVAGSTFTITSTLTSVTTTPVTYGTPLAAQALPAHGSGFHTLDLTTTNWIQAGVSAATDWGTTARISLYDLAGEGWLNSGYNPVQAVASAVPLDGTNPLQRITRDDARDYLVRVGVNGTVGAAPTYTLDIKERPHAVLGPVVAGTPFTRTGMDLLAQTASKGFLVLSTAGNVLTSTVTPSSATTDISIERRNVDGSIPSGGTINGGLLGAAETLTGTVPTTPAFVAFTVTNRDLLASTNLGFNITSQSATMYTVATGNIAFADACATGTTIMTNQDDSLSAAITLPAGFTNFPLLGFPTGGSVKVSSNGFLTFDTAQTSSAPQNVAIPTAGTPNWLIAGYWDDLTGIDICRKDDLVAGTVTFQWEGYIYDDTAETAQFQIVLHSNGVIDLIYGAGHLLNGSELPAPPSDANGASVGVENSNGTFGQQLLFNTNGIAPSTSRTLTPM